MKRNLFKTPEEAASREHSIEFCRRDVSEDKYITEMLDRNA